METFIENTLRLLNLEREAEKEENRTLIENISPKQLQKEGVCLLNLRISTRKSAMFGRTLVVFTPYWSDNSLPSHSMTPGDILGLSPSHGDCGELIGTGVVTQARRDSISLAFDDFSCSGIFDLDDDEKWKLVKLANDITYKRLRRSMEKLRSFRSGPASHLVDVLLDSADLKSPLMIAKDIEFDNDNLNPSQREAVQFALNQSDIAVVHGPPGTGKSTTLIEIIHQAVKLKMKVLACAPSNVAVDNLVLRLAARGAVKLVRLGHPARLHADIQRYSLDAIISGSEEKQLARDVRKNIDETMAKLRKSRSLGEKQSLRQEMKYLRKELIQREETATREILKKADVVLATLSSSSDDGPIRLLDTKAGGGFDLVVIDECSQAMEASCWIALLQGKRCVLAGDHQQLPPTILSKQAAKEGLERTLMERVLSEHGDHVVRMLDTQYRMHEKIMRWSSEQLYDGRLTAHKSVAAHLLRDLSHVEETEETSIPLLLIDTAGCNLSELVFEDHVSKGNEGEADLVAVHVNSLLSAGLREEEIAVIAPYNLQVQFIRKRLAAQHPKLEIKSVDSFQGREKEAVVISLVRSNEAGVVGFLAEDRRINVAITRARRHLAVIGDSITVGHHRFLRSLMDYMSQEGEVRTAHQYQQDHQIGGSTIEGAGLAKPSQRVEAKSKIADKQKSAVRDKTGGNDWEEVKKKEASFPNLRKMIEKFFTDDTETEYQFSTALTKAERKYVHEVCEEFDIQHSSHGTDDQRYILINKSLKSTDVNVAKTEDAKNDRDVIKNDGDVTKNKGHINVIDDDVEKKGRSLMNEEIAQLNPELKQIPELDCSNLATDEDERNSSRIGNESETKTNDHSQIQISFNTDSNGEKRHSTMSKSPSVFQCEKCQKSVPLINYELHALRCRTVTIPETKAKAKPVDVRPKSANTNNTSTSSKNTKKKKANDLQKISAIQKTDSDDLDLLIAAAQADDNVCNFIKCKVSTALIGQQCPFCNRRYCLKHHIAEVHGCGDLAKHDARQTICREGKLYPGSGVPNKKMDANKRAHLHRKLDKTIGEKEANRKIKKKDK